MFVYLPLGYLLGMAAWSLAGVFALRLLLRQRYKFRTNSRRRRWVHAGLSLWSVLAVATVSELTFAVFVDQSDSFNMTNISQRWFELHVERQRNKFGARDAKEFPKHIPQGKHRICFVGDSFTIGHGIDDLENRFSDRVAVMLERDRPGKFLVANLADPGLEISMIQATVLGLLRAGYEVDTVVYVLCLNDIEGYDPQTAETIKKLQQYEPRSFLFTKTYLFNWLYFRFIQFSKPEVSDYFPHLKKSYDSPAWDGMRAKLDQLHNDCKSHSVDLRIVIFPFMQHIGSSYAFAKAHQKLVDYCRSAGIPVLDLEPVFRPHAGENLRVNRYDAHPNERAHEIAAKAIYEELLKDLPANPNGSGS